MGYDETPQYITAVCGLTHAAQNAHRRPLCRSGELLVWWYGSRKVWKAAGWGRDAGITLTMWLNWARASELGMSAGDKIVFESAEAARWQGGFRPVNNCTTRSCEVYGKLSYIILS